MDIMFIGAQNRPAGRAEKQAEERKRLAMPIQHLSRESSSDSIAEALKRDGCVVLDNVLSRDEIDQLARDMAPYMEAAPKGKDEFDGFETRRAGTLIARSPKAREIIMNPRILDVTAKLLSHAAAYQLHLTESIWVGPGSTAQEIHKDQGDFEGFCFPKEHDTIVATIWALTDFTEANGATRVVPGSHKLEGAAGLRGVGAGFPSARTGTGSLPAGASQRCT